MSADIKNSIRQHQPAFDLELTDAQVDRLGAFYDLVQQHNPLLHLVGPCSAEEFATRHLLESLTLLKHLPQDAKFADVGTGAGLPSIPCLLAREDLKATLIESNRKKAAFLDDALRLLGLNGRASVINKQYAEADAGDAQVVTSRALDKFSERLPHLIRWGRTRRLILFAGEGIAEQLKTLGRKFSAELLPLSERRYVFVVEGRATSLRRED